MICLRLHFEKKSGKSRAGKSNTVSHAVREILRQNVRVFTTHFQLGSQSPSQYSILSRHGIGMSNSYIVGNSYIPKRQGQWGRACHHCTGYKKNGCFCDKITLQGATAAPFRKHCSTLLLQHFSFRSEPDHL